MISVLFAFLILAVLGVALSIGLSVADKKFSVKKDEKLVKLEESMPGANCGGCGYAGCSDYANAVFNGSAKIGLCMPGGKELCSKMSEIMGVEEAVYERKVAFVFCNASNEENIKLFNYKGLRDCTAASILFDGDNACKNGCLHMLSCRNVCDNKAIHLTENGTVVVDKEKCIGCGKCVGVCPHHVIKLIPYDLPYAVKCNNHNKGAAVSKSCIKGCIGCKICEVKFPGSGIKVQDNLGVVSADYNIEDLKLAAAGCPRKVIEGHN